MDAKEIRKLLDAVAATDVNELVLETGEYKLTVKRGAPEAETIRFLPQPGPSQASAPAPAQQEAVVAAAAPPAASPERAEAQAQPEPTSDLVPVTAPIVGTFYEAPSPDAEPYVKVGDRVERGTVLCIIEAMKLMNEIEAEVAGTISEILVRNEEPVEYGQVLFRIEPS